MAIKRIFSVNVAVKVDTLSTRAMDIFQIKLQKILLMDMAKRFTKNGAKTIDNR